MLDIEDGTAQLTLTGDLNETAIPAFRTQLDKIVALQQPLQRVVLRMENLHSISQGAANAISFYSGKINTPQNFYIVGTNDGVKNVLQNVGILGSLNVMDSYDASKVGIS